MRHIVPVMLATMMMTIMIKIKHAHSHICILLRDLFINKLAEKKLFKDFFSLIKINFE